MSLSWFQLNEILHFQAVVKVYKKDDEHGNNKLSK